MKGSLYVLGFHKLIKNVTILHDLRQTSRMWPIPYKSRLEKVFFCDGLSIIYNFLWWECEQGFGFSLSHAVKTSVIDLVPISGA